MLTRISSSRSRLTFTVESASTGLDDLYQLMLSRTEPRAYSNIRARSLPELREYLANLEIETRRSRSFAFFVFQAVR